MQVAETTARAFLVPEIAPPRGRAGLGPRRAAHKGPRRGTRSVRERPRPSTSDERRGVRRSDERWTPMPRQVAEEIAAPSDQSWRRRRSPKGQRGRLWCARFVGSRECRVLQVRKPSGSREDGVPQAAAAATGPPFVKTAEPKGARDSPAARPSGLCAAKSHAQGSRSGAGSVRERQGPSAGDKRRGVRRLKNGGPQCRAQVAEDRARALLVPEIAPPRGQAAFVPRRAAHKGLDRVPEASAAPNGRQVAEDRARGAVVPQIGPPLHRAALCAAKSAKQGPRWGATAPRSAKRFRRLHSKRRNNYSTVTDFARLRGWSTSQPRSTAMARANSCRGTLVTMGENSSRTFGT